MHFAIDYSKSASGAEPDSKQRLRRWLRALSVHLVLLDEQRQWEADEWGHSWIQVQFIGIHFCRLQEEVPRHLHIQGP